MVQQEEKPDETAIAIRTIFEMRLIFIGVG
jgi:hypothetical protein